MSAQYLRRIDYYWHRKNTIRTPNSHARGRNAQQKPYHRAATTTKSPIPKICCTKCMEYSFSVIDTHLLLSSVCSLNDEENDTRSFDTTTTKKTQNQREKKRATNVH